MKLNKWEMNKVSQTNKAKDIPDLSLKLNDEGEVKIVILSDVHLGQAAHNQELFERFLQKIRDIDAYVILNGDLIEFAIPVHMPATMFGQVMPVQDQIDAIDDYLMPMRERVVFLTDGNHEARQWKRTGTDLSLNLAEKLGCFYNKWGGFMRFRVGKQSYTMGAWHGHSGASANIWLEPEKRWSFHSQADVVAMGHIHQLAHKALPKFHLNEDGEQVRRYVHFIRTGSYLTNADYALGVGYPPTLDGSPILTLSSKNHRVEVDVRGETI